MTKITKKTSIRIRNALFEKLRKIAKQEGRSVNAQINLYIAEYLAAFEKEHGEIETEE